MKIPCCSVCQSRYDEVERVPLLLQCGHGFCKECLSRMYSASQDTSLSCPRCRHMSVVGNSVSGLSKNYAMLALIHSVSGNNHLASVDCDFTDDEDEDEEDGEVLDVFGNGDVDGKLRRRRIENGKVGGVGGERCEVGGVGMLSRHELKFIRRIREVKRIGVEMWYGVLIGGSGGGMRCRHKVAVKKVVIVEDTDTVWVQGQLENLRLQSTWCRNVCTFHGVIRMDGCLCIVMDRCYGSVQSEMQQNEGRLTLEQILRCSLPLQT